MMHATNHFLVIVCIFIICNYVKSNEPDRVELASDGVMWHTFIGSQRNHQFHRFGEDQCICLDETNDEKISTRSLRRMCYCKPELESDYERIFCIAEIPEGICYPTAFLTVGRTWAGYVGLWHDDMILHVQNNKPLSQEDDGTVTSMQGVSSIDLVIRKVSKEEKTTITVLRAPDLHGPVVARIEISGQGTKHESATKADIWRFSNDISMDHLLLLTARNIVRYAQNRNRFASWMMDTSSKLLIESGLIKSFAEKALAVM